LNSTNVLVLIPNIFRQFQNYQTVFRDGNDTDRRTFSFIKNYTIAFEGDEITVSLGILKDKESYFRIIVGNNVNVKALGIFKDRMIESFGELFQNETGFERNFKVDPYRLMLS
jgi:hypothetical protein